MVVDLHQQSSLVQLHFLAERGILATSLITADKFTHDN
jgi:hypothetical protein